MKDKATRKAEAIKRDKAYHELTYSQRLINLGLRLGGQVEATKERAKIKNAIANMAVAAPAYPAQEAKLTKKPYQKPKKS